MKERRFYIVRSASSSNDLAADYYYDRLIARGGDPDTDPHLEAARKKGWTYTPPEVSW